MVLVSVITYKKFYINIRSFKRFSQLKRTPVFYDIRRSKHELEIERCLSVINKIDRMVINWN